MPSVGQFVVLQPTDAMCVAVVFGEILPQSICVRYGLQIGGIMAKPVLALMWLLAPIAWPTAKILDHALGEDHGTVYKKSGLKTLVTLHRSLGEVSERLNQDEVTIISAVLDLKEKPVSSVMTPMEDVFTMSEDTILDEKMMDMILSAGYSRIPIHEPYNPTNFVGMLLVKILITYDPDDKSRVSEFPLATLPETRPETSCLDIVNFFQEGKSHMVLVSQYPGEDHGALGVVTLEDVIEELIGEWVLLFLSSVNLTDAVFTLTISGKSSMNRTFILMCTKQFADSSPRPELGPHVTSLWLQGLEPRHQQRPQTMLVTTKSLSENMTMMSFLRDSKRFRLCARYRNLTWILGLYQQVQRRQR